ncbi:Wolfram syndrome 1 [Operophtera brumata]|uniref:Wolfram syndrome 1 n=1 Tax=Operophtera brumata TaxID=104452 RepID=A0A0L7LDZ0_OPEBR|nr:Wolfram syndrome 1 [Operophtera brumata]
MVVRRKRVRAAATTGDAIHRHGTIRTHTPEEEEAQWLYDGNALEQLQLLATRYTATAPYEHTRRRKVGYLMYYCRRSTMVVRRKRVRAAATTGDAIHRHGTIRTHTPEEEEAQWLHDGNALEQPQLQAGDAIHSNDTIRTHTPEEEEARGLYDGNALGQPQLLAMRYTDTARRKKNEEARGLYDGNALGQPQLLAMRYTDTARRKKNEYSESYNSTEDIRNLNVDNLVSAAVDYCQGELPLVSYELTLTDPSLKSLDHIPLLQQAFLHPIVFIQVLYLKLLYHFGSFSFRLSNVELSVFLIGYLSVNSESLYHVVPLVFYYISFVAMVICTFKMLHAKRQFIDFRKWSGLFLRYSDGSLETDQSENLFVRNNLGPFLQFFVALFVNLFLYPFIATQWVPFSEFCVLSFFLMFLTLISFGTSGKPYPDFLALLSFGINVLAKYPYEKDTVVHQGWRFLDLQISNYPSYILGNSIEFCVNSRVVFSLLIPVILVVMAKRSNWQGFFKFTLPHCVTLSWLQMFIMCSHGCTAYGLVRGTLALVCSFLFLPLIGVVTITLPVIAFLQYISLSRVIYALSVVFFLGVSLCVTCVLAKSEVTKKFVTPFQLIIGFLTLFYFGNQFAIQVQDDGLPSTLIELVTDDKSSIKNLLKSEFITDYEENTYHINWDDYYNHCNNPSWSDYNMAATQIKCSVLDGATVNWEGYIQDVNLVNVKNFWKDFVSWMPGFLQEYFKCYYGEEYATLCRRSEGLQSVDECEFVTRASGGLLKRHAEISVQFDHYFTNFTRLLRYDDKVTFKGILSNDNGPYVIGTKTLTVKGHAISCIECKEARGTISSEAPSSSKLSELLKTIVNDCMVSTKYILNFLLNPVIIFK